MYFYGKVVRLGGIKVMKMIKILFYSLLILLILNGCSSNEVKETEDLFQFKNSYVGDAGAVGNITMKLPKPNGEKISGLELETTEEPYGIIVNYSSTEENEPIEVNYNELALFNATFILSLVQNADWVKFNFVEQELKISREELQNYYGKDIREFNNEEELSKFIQENLADETRVTQFYNERT